MGDVRQGTARGREKASGRKCVFLLLPSHLLLPFLLLSPAFHALLLLFLLLLRLCLLLLTALACRYITRASAGVSLKALSPKLRRQRRVMTAPKVLAYLPPCNIPLP